MLTFVTTNAGKVHEAEQYLGSVEQLEYDYTEIQGDTLGAVAAYGAQEAYLEVDGPVFVDDSGLFIDALGGFPGPYSSYVDDRLGIERVWALTEPEETHTAAFKTAIAYCDGESFDTTGDDSVRGGGPATGTNTGSSDGRLESEDGPPVKLFEGRVPGSIVAPRGEGGFGYDPLFEHDGRTFAEMSTSRKNAVSHRGRALAKLADWLDETARLATDDASSE